MPRSANQNAIDPGSLQRIPKEQSPNHHAFREARKSAPTWKGRHALAPYLDARGDFAKRNLQHATSRGPCAVHMEPVFRQGHGQPPNCHPVQLSSLRLPSRIGDTSKRGLRHAANPASFHCGRSDRRRRRDAPGPLDAAAAQSAVQPVIKQIALTEKLVQSFIDAQKEMSAVLGKIQGATAEQLPPRCRPSSKPLPGRHGFRDFDEYDARRR